MLEARVKQAVVLKKLLDVQYAYVHPQNLSNAWPWLEGITTVSQFDVAALNYFVDPDQFQQTKFVNQLGCTNATGAVLRWERSVLCSQWVNSQWGRACTALYNGTSAATSQKMVCQSTCLEYSASERSIVNSTYCPGPAPTDGTREARLLKDYVDCTAWTTLATNDTATCVQGYENEGNCGFGTSTAQLCGYCRGDQPDDCCYQANVDQSVCGFALPARASSSGSASPSSTFASVAPSGTTASDQANSGTGNGTSLSNGQLAGTIVGSVLGGLLLLALLLLLLFCLRRRRRAANQQHNAGITPDHRPQSGGAFSSMFGGSASGSAPASGLGHAGTGEKSRALGGLGSGAGGGSEKALLGANQNLSSPTMNGSIAQGGKGMLSSGSLGAPAAAAAGAGLAGAGAGAAAGAGARNSVMSAGGGRTGNVLPRVKDENQDGERFIEQGGEVTVLWPYTATLPDELDLRPGMRLRVVRLYDDAWGTGQVISSPESSGSDVGRQGAFPIVCVSEGSSFGSSRSDTSV